eukprot:TRINITY_DN5599_c0_g1_i1.p1 TRINITY_DN5599_c0_g1~~TRINITY_DN5599_c0_g1_i1.p1  ORF type:complete len:259 (-),score=73.66 TRINITY_DN5599_c0_g1_i1:735-1511(-)
MEEDEADVARKLRAALSHSRAEVLALNVKCDELEHQNRDLASKLEHLMLAAPASPPPAPTPPPVIVREDPAAVVREEKLRDELGHARQKNKKLESKLGEMEQMQQLAADQEGAASECARRKIESLSLELESTMAALRCAETELELVQNDADGLMVLRQNYRDLEATVTQLTTTKIRSYEHISKLKIENEHLRKSADSKVRELGLELASVRTELHVNQVAEDEARERVSRLMATRDESLQLQAQYKAAGLTMPLRGNES